MTTKAIEDVVQKNIVMIEIRTDTDKTIDQETVTLTKKTADITLLILDLSTITSEIAHKALSIEIGAIVTDPTILDPRTERTNQLTDNIIGMFPKQHFVSQTVQDRVIEEESCNQNSRDNSREPNSNTDTVWFRDNKTKVFFVDNQQDETNLN